MKIKKLTSEGLSFSISLNKNDNINCIPNYIIGISKGVSVKESVVNNFWSKLRNYLLIYKFEKKQFRSVEDGAEILIAPQSMGSFKIIDVSNEEQYYIKNESFVASDDIIEFKNKKFTPKKMIGFKDAIFTQETNGIGSVIIFGFGSIIEKIVEKDKPILINSSNIIAWDKRLGFEIKKNPLSYLSRKGTVDTIENNIVEISGEGKIYLSSSSKEDFIKKIATYFKR